MYFINYLYFNYFTTLIIGGVLCDLELQKSKQETRCRPGKSKGAGSPTLATRPHFKSCIHVIKGEMIVLGYVLSRNISDQVGGTCPLIHPNYLSVMIFVSVTELTSTLTLTLNRPKNNSGELTDKHQVVYDL